MRPVQHVDLIGSFTPDMLAVDDAVMRRARIFIDTEHARIESGDIKLPPESGAIRQSDIVATLAGLSRGEDAARTSDEEITLFKGVGLAAEDLSATVLAMRMSAAS